MRDNDIYQEVRPCKNDMAVEAIPVRNLKLDLDKLAEQVAPPFEIIRKLPVLLLLKETDFTVELTIFPSGKLLVKNAPNTDVARGIVERFVKQFLP